MFIALATDFVN